MNSIINRIRFMFSVETVVTGVIVYFLLKIPTINNWISPPFSFLNETMKGNIEQTLQEYEQYKNMEYLRSMILFFLTIIVVFGIGELIRRKRKCKSLFSNDEAKRERK